MKIKPYPQFRYFSALIFIALITGCASKYKIHGTVGGEPGAHKVTEVMALASAEQIKSMEFLVGPLESAGVGLADIENGTVIVGRIYCCGGAGTVETENSVFVYVPQDMNVEQSDVIEFIEGYGPKGEGKSQLNVAVKVRHKNGIQTGACTWEPNDPRLWFRVIYCPWMENEGWKKGSGLSPEWLKKSSQSF